MRKLFILVAALAALAVPSMAFAHSETDNGGDWYQVFENTTTYPGGLHIGASSYSAHAKFNLYTVTAGHGGASTDGRAWIEAKDCSSCSYYPVWGTVGNAASSDLLDVRNNSTSTYTYVGDTALHTCTASHYAYHIAYRVKIITGTDQSNFQPWSWGDSFGSYVKPPAGSSC